MARAASPDVRARILEAAEARLWRYGFKKTTIDEIAADAGVGKGTVYLHFDSKEDIALAIIAHYKQSTVEHLQTLAHDAGSNPVQRLKEMLTQPVLRAHALCAQSPAALEIVVAVRPRIQEIIRPYIEQEVALLAEVLEAGCRGGHFAVADTQQAARTLKYMTAGFWPPYPAVIGPENIEIEIARIVDLTVRGLRPCQD